MPFKVTVLYGTPSDPEAFERRYAGPHTEVSAPLRHLMQGSRFRVVDVVVPGEADVYRTAEAWFETRDEVDLLLASPELARSLDDLREFATGGFTVFVSESG